MERDKTTELPPIQVPDTLARGGHELQLRKEGEVSVYCCGPTTYDVAHVGHARSALAFDLLFFAVDELPSTVPVALTLATLELSQRRWPLGEAGG